MSELIKRPIWLEHFNQFGLAAGGVDRLIPIECEELKHMACEAARLSDFGDFPWEEGFQKLVWGLNNEAQLNTMGRVMVRAELLRTLQVRLRLTEFWKNHPEVLESSVNPPIVIAGAARTGTSILQEVLSQDGQFHLPYTWKCLDPLPLQGDKAADKALRIQKAQCESDFWEDVQPELHAMHDFGAELPTECIVFLSSDYCSDYWAMIADMPTWNAWRIENGYFNDTYRWHKRYLQTMQYGEPAGKTWLLKSPAHIAFLDVIKEVYPGVKIIHTHRDPLKCIPSTASITSTVRWERSDAVDAESVGRNIAFGFQFSMENVINQRESGDLPESHIADIQLRDLIAEPVSAIKAIYDHFGLTFADGMEQKVLDYLANKPKGKFGTHTYSLATFGLEESALREQFARYTDYYGIEPEK